uniref:Uncharacterized protein n=1 Tax=Arundo donax TaxID=35708 RepID=A0A0A9CDA3_ARUDO
MESWNIFCDTDLEKHVSGSGFEILKSFLRGESKLRCYQLNITLFNNTNCN